MTCVYVFAYLFVGLIVSVIGCCLDYRDVKDSYDDVNEYIDDLDGDDMMIDITAGLFWPFTLILIIFVCLIPHFLKKFIRYIMLIIYERNNKK